MRAGPISSAWACVVFGGLATACLGGSLLASSRDTTRVESNPPGAEVYVMGERLGTTPLEVEDRLVYPVHYPREKAELYGRIELRKDGCETTVRALDLRASNEGLVVELRCAETPPTPLAPGGGPLSE